MNWDVFGLVAGTGLVACSVVFGLVALLVKLSDLFGFWVLPVGTLVISTLIVAALAGAGYV